MSIGAVKAMEIGAGRECVGMQGSEMNDPMLMREGKIDFESNHAEELPLSGRIIVMLRYTAFQIMPLTRSADLISANSPLMYSNLWSM
jgi:hypothetical protein